MWCSIGHRRGAEVIACGSSEWKLARRKEIGATHVIDTSKGRQSEGRAREVWETTLYRRWRRGCGCELYRCRHLGFELQIIGSDGWTYEDQIALMNIVVEGKLKPVIHSTRPLAETRQALQELIDRKVFGKSVLTVTD